METLCRNGSGKLKWKLKLNQSGDEIVANTTVTPRSAHLFENPPLCKDHFVMVIISNT